MSSHLEKVLRNAEKKLGKASGRNPQDALAVYCDFLKGEEHQLYQKHNNGEGGLGFVQKRADLLDVVLRHIWKAALKPLEASDHKKSLALVAVGGYGRRELCPYSDIDLLFLSKYSLKKSPAANLLKGAIEKMLYVLWDMDFKVGHASRTLGEVVEEGNSDLRTKTALLDVRLIAGSKTFFSEFQKKFKESCMAGKEEAYLEWRLKDQEARHRKYGGSVYVQEPNLKNSCGGLRDYQNLLWTAQVRYGISSTSGLVNKGWLTKGERQALDQAYDFLLKIRNEIHFQQKRPDDLLTLKMQGQIADAFHYPQKNILRRIEAFMKDYYQHATNIYQISSLHARRIAEGESGKKKSFWEKLPFQKTLEVDGFLIKDKKIYLKSKHALSDASKLLRLFQIMQQHNAHLSSELENTLRKKKDPIPPRVCSHPEVREKFIDLLRKKGKVGRVMREMHQLRLMGKFIPEFEPLTCLVQHEFFHVYTADEHTLICLEQLDKVVDCDEEPFSKYRELFLRCRKPGILYLALILHDVGKATNSSNHSEDSAQLASKTAKRLKMRGRDLQNLLFLVYHHGTLSEFAQRRSLEESETIREFARIVQDVERLDMLMLMTFVDAQATSAGSNWSSWKELLTWNLYRQTSQMLQGEEEFLKKRELDRAEIHGRVRKVMPSSVDDGELSAHFALLPKPYFHSTGEQLIARHVGLIHKFFIRNLNLKDDALKPLVEWVNKENEGHSEVMVVTWDREQLFSKIAGAFAMAELNILSADVFTRDDNIVVDTFRVCTPRYEAANNKVERRIFEETLTKSLLDSSFDLRKELKKKQAAIKTYIEGAEFPTLIHLDNDASSKYTLIHVRTPDRIGLLFEITSCFSNFALTIYHSRISTEKGAALDTFYVSPLKGGKVEDSETQAKLLKALQSAVVLKK